MEQMIDESDIAERKSFDEPSGLKNIGNTCWFNSVVQALYTLPYFRQLILNFQYPTMNRVLTDSVCLGVFIRMFFFNYFLK
jgi:ubiquitin C-terminal hydrolase